MVFGIIPECRSASLRNERSPSPESPLEGPFANFAGTVVEISSDQSTLQVSVTIAGRRTPVEVQSSQIQKT
jgi:hypothetical protein